MLLVTSVPRALEVKTKLFGFELGDVLLIFMYLAVSNMLFGNTSLKFLMVWVGTATIAGALFFAKKNKPPNWAEHLVQYFVLPPVFSAGCPDIFYQPFFREIDEEIRKIQRTQ